MDPGADGRNIGVMEVSEHRKVKRLETILLEGLTGRPKSGVEQKEMKADIDCADRVWRMTDSSFYPRVSIPFP